MRKLFGTDGIRGKANSFPLIPEFIQRLGCTIASLTGEGKRFLIGKDTRLSSDMIESALISGITACGGVCYSAGVISTPAISLLTKEMGMDFGIVISASHNPAWENGIKFFSSNGEKIPDSLEERLEEELKKEAQISYPDFTKIGYIKRIEKEACDHYIKSIYARFPQLNLERRKIVIDCANGAAVSFAETLFSKLGAEPIMIHHTPNGLNINEGCGSLHPKSCAEKVKEVGAWMGLCFDGDADRVIFIDSEGNILDGDHVLAICAKYMKKEGMLKKNVVVSTIMSNMGLEKFLKNMDIELQRTKVGDRFVWEKMKEVDVTLGGEQSGHIIFSHLSCTGDGAITACMVFSILLQEKIIKPLEYIKEFEKMPQVLLNVKIKERKDPFSFKEIKDSINEAERRLEGEGRINVRLSGTEDVVRIMVEAKNEELAYELASLIKEAIQKHM